MSGLFGAAVTPYLHRGLADFGGLVDAADVRRVVAEPESRFVFRVDFVTADVHSARRTARMLAEALGILRADVDVYSASMVSVDGGCEPLFCLSGGPDGEFCGRPSGHAGWHAEPGFGGLRWGDGDGAV